MKLVLLLALIAHAAPPDATVEPQAGDAQAVGATAPVEATPVELRLQEQLKAMQARLDAQQQEIAALRAPQLAVPPATPARDQVLIGQDVLVEENTVANNAVSIGGDVIVNGHVLRDVQAIGGSVRMGPPAVVDGDAIAVGGTIEMAPGAILRGDRVAITSNLIGLQDRALGVVATFYQRVVTLFTLVGGGLLTIALFPQRVERTARMIEERPLRSALLGSAIAFFVLVGALLFAVTIIGVPLSLVLLAGLASAWCLGWTALAALIGERLAAHVSGAHGWRAFLLGAAVLGVVVQLPVLGDLIVATGTLLVTGGAMVSRLGTVSPR